MGNRQLAIVICSEYLATQFRLYYMNAMPVNFIIVVVWTLTVISSICAVAHWWGLLVYPSSHQSIVDGYNGYTRIFSPVKYTIVAIIGIIYITCYYIQ